MGCSVLADSYGDANSFADPSRPFGVALPSFPISELSRTRSLFHQYGSEIGSALLLAALPQAYATSWGARVLAATGHLQNDRPGDLTRRIRATAQFVTFVLGPSGFVAEGEQSNGAIENAWDARSANKGQAFRSVMGLRLLHQTIRTILTEHPDQEAVEAVLGPENWPPACQPLNQEDLLATQLLFCVTVFEVLEKFGLSWSGEDQIAYLTTWNMIGRLIGIVAWDPGHWPQLEEWPELNPKSVDGARRLLELLRISTMEARTALRRGDGRSSRFIGSARRRMEFASAGSTIDQGTSRRARECDGNSHPVMASSHYARASPARGERSPWTWGQRTLHVASRYFASANNNHRLVHEDQGTQCSQGRNTSIHGEYRDSGCRCVVRALDRPTAFCSSRPGGLVCKLTRSGSEEQEQRPLIRLRPPRPS